MNHRRISAGAVAAALLLGACSNSSDDQSDARSGDATASTIELRTSDGDDNATSRDRAGSTAGDDSAGRLSATTAPSSVSAGGDTDEEEGGGLSQDAVEQAVTGETAPQRIDRPSRTRTTEPEDTTFVDAGVNPFVDTVDDHQSTFALDVDTASYTVGRAWINQGILPDPASVRVEEWINYLDQDYDPPRQDTFAIYADAAPHPFVNDDTYLVRIGIAARDVSERQRDPANLTLVVDTSGSMDKDRRIELVQEAMLLLAEQLDEDDSVAIVSYSDNARVVLEPTAGDDFRAIQDAVNRLRPDGSTNAEAGLTLGYDLADEMWRRDSTNRVVLLSDGVANVGASGPESILERIGDNARRDIHLVSIGVGFGNFNDHLLEQLADQGDGWYAYIDDVDEARRVFVDDLVGSLQVVAEDAKVQVEFDARTVEAYRLIGFENREIADRDFRNDRVDAGEIGAGHTVTALYEVDLHRGVRLGDGDELALVSLRWNEPGARRADEVSGVITTDTIDDNSRNAGAHFRLTAAAATFAEILRESPYVRGVDLDDVLDVAEDAARDIDTDEAWDLVDLIDQATTLR